MPKHQKMDVYQRNIVASIYNVLGLTIFQNGKPSTTV